MRFLNKILNFIYPNVCLHCKQKLQKKYYLLCLECLQTLYYLDSPFEKDSFVVFERTQPISTLLKELKKQNILGITKIIASFLVIQHNKLKWDMPDVILSLHKKNFISKNHGYCLAKEVAKIFNKPLMKKIKENQIALVISDVLDLSKFNIFKSKLTFKKINCLALSFDIFFDDFNLPE